MKNNINLISNITRKSQSTEECFNCPIAAGCSWCSAYNYEQFGTPNKRATNICCMHKAASLANVYYWNKIYSKNKRWLASLDIIIPDCPSDTFESGIIEPMAPRRIKCGQVCEIDGRCHFCENALKTANGATLRYYNAQKEKS